MSNNAITFSLSSGESPAWRSDRNNAARMPSEIASLGLNCAGQALAQHMLHDKKMDAGTLPFLLLRGIGEAFLAKDVALDDVAAFLDGELA